jgi:excisionase family DNA binding protein
VTADALTVSVPEAAVLLGYSDTAIYDLLDKGVLPELPRVNRRRLIPRRAIDQMVDHAMAGFDPAAAFDRLKAAS